MSIGPFCRHTWFAENIILITFMTVLISSYGKFRFSNVSYGLILLFSILQTIGAHYTYERVPMGWFTHFFGFERNHYDRIVHFSFGFLLAYPFREFLIKTSGLKNKFWSHYFPVEMALGAGAIFEIIEWFYVARSSNSAGRAFLGSQGDIWDAQADMLMAGIGATISMAICWLIVKTKAVKEYE
jgi:putative membrane protein